ncbi:MAG: UTP--glucose-1-phosphate uridylyltransferase [Planctomycetota bacterium]|jgi:UDP-N-acetylglucosamine/UDP-N-acetylgalactosamine diphosphorylase
MTAKKSLENIRKLLKKHHQSHLLAFWDQLDPDQRQNLLAQIEQLDLPKIDDWVANIVKNPAPAALPARFQPAPSYHPVPANPQLHATYDQARELAENLISAGKVAAFVVAGGQGTRLGFQGPKGNFPISPVKNKSLFQIFAETIEAASQKYQTTCPWYIMTSPLNHHETKHIFERNNFYGLDKKNVFIFQQGTLPNFGLDGKILLTDKAHIACSPDGHGGSLKALFQSDALDDMKKRGIEFISYWQVDNPLVNVFDPLFIGLHALEKAEMSSKAIVKTHPREKVGNFCLVDGRVTVIEYSDLPDELTEKRNPDGSLLFQLGSIAIHIINTAFVEKINARGFSLPLHRALKKIPHLDEQGDPLEPEEPNGIKLETFVFDALPLASKSVILETLRSQEFAPVKNATGPDSPETAGEIMVARAADWLESAGISIPKKPDGSPDCLLEIAPGFALQKDDIKEKLRHIPPIRPGDSLYLA